MKPDGFIYVGDPHVQKSNLEESTRLLDWIRGLSQKYNLPVVFGGDQYNDHGSQRVEVIEFWVKAFGRFEVPVIALVGNHDMNHEGDATVMKAHANDRVSIVDCPGKLTQWPGWGAVPFCRKNEDFVAGCMRLYQEGVRTILCHQEIDGAQYENGFYAPHGVKLSDLPADLKLISGHIHKQQEFGNVWFPGTPRQLTRSDADDQKGVWIVAFDGRRKFIPTPEEVCTPFKIITITPDTAQQVVPDTSRVYVDISGPKDFVLDYVRKLSEGRKEQLHIRTNPDPDEVVTDIKESEGINVAFSKYLRKYYESEKVSPEDQVAISETIYRLCPSLKRASGQ